MGDEQGAASGAHGAGKGAQEAGGTRPFQSPVARSVESDSYIHQASRVKLTKAIIDKVGPIEGCTRRAGIELIDDHCIWHHTDLSVDNRKHSDKCSARVEALMAADLELRKRLESAQKRQEEYMVKRAEAGAEPSRRDRGAEPPEEPRAPSPPDATAAAGFSAVPVQGEARGLSLTLRGGDSRRRSEGILRFVL